MIFACAGLLLPVRVLSGAPDHRDWNSVMRMTGQFRIALVPDAEPRAFEAHMNDRVFQDPNALQLTRITRQFAHQLFDAGDRQYVWQAIVDLQTSGGYDFHENLEHVREQLKDHAVVIDVESFQHV